MSGLEWSYAPEEYLETDWDLLGYGGPFCYLHHDYYLCDNCGEVYGPFERGIEHPFMRMKSGITWCMSCGLKKLLEMCDVNS